MLLLPVQGGRLGFIHPLSRRRRSYGLSLLGIALQTLRGDLSSFLRIGARTVGGG
jgi:hypothetical protein